MVCGACEQRGETGAFGLELRALQPRGFGDASRRARFFFGLRAALFGVGAAAMRRGELARQLGDPPLEEDDLFQRGAQQIRCRRLARCVVLTVRQGASGMDRE